MTLNKLMRDSLVDYYLFALSFVSATHDVARCDNWCESNQQIQFDERQKWHVIEIIVRINASRAS